MSDDLDTDAPDTDEMMEDIGGGVTPRISLTLGGLSVEVEGGEGDDLADVKTVYDDVREDALAEAESVSQALRSRLMGWR